MSATVVERPDLRATVLRLREVMAKAPPALAPVVAEPSAPPPAPVEPETVETIASEAETLLREALDHAGIQRDSIRMVLACHAAMVRLAPAQVREIGALVQAAREPMTPEERDAWKAEFMGAVTAALARLEGIHRQGAQDYALALRDEARRLVRATDAAAIWRAAGAMGGSWLVGLLMGGVIVAALLRHGF